MAMKAGADGGGRVAGGGARCRGAHSSHTQTAARATNDQATQRPLDGTSCCSLALIILLNGCAGRQGGVGDDLNNKRDDDGAAATGSLLALHS